MTPSDLKQLDIQPLNKASFAPFGTVIETDGATQIGINQGTTIRFDAMAGVDAAAAGVRVAARARAPGTSAAPTSPSSSPIASGPCPCGPMKGAARARARSAVGSRRARGAPPRRRASAAARPRAGGHPPRSGRAPRGSRRAGSSCSWPRAARMFPL